MLDMNQWLTDYQKAMNATFGDRVLFIGLQGSYARGEATEQSDIDVVLILDAVTIADLNIYKKITAALPHAELLCGFVSGKAELQGWCRHDLFQFYYDTTNVTGNLGDMIEVPTGEDAKQAVYIGACNLYHGCSHNYLHAMDVDMLTSLYKAAFFVLQAKYFCETGKYINRRTKLADCLAGDDLAILRLSGQPGAITTDNLSEATARLLHWSSALICKQCFGTASQAV